MDPFEEFITRLLREGLAVFREPPRPVSVCPSGVMAELERAFRVHRRGVAGPPISFDRDSAGAAAILVREACWALVHRGERADSLTKRLTMPHEPGRPAHHLSADVVLRLLPQVLRRANGMDPSDPIVSALSAVLRRWPLSGVLADLDEGPSGPTDLGHPGLSLLYAERWVRRERPAWRPAGPGMEYVELVKQTRDGAARGGGDD